VWFDDLVQCNAVECSAVEWSAVECSGVEWGGVLSKRHSVFLERTAVL
jgi:hypothetical protein